MAFLSTDAINYDKSIFKQKVQALKNFCHCFKVILGNYYGIFCAIEFVTSSHGICSKLLSRGFWHLKGLSAN
jgi:hypothetical protein